MLIRQKGKYIELKGKNKIRILNCLFPAFRLELNMDKIEAKLILQSVIEKFTLKNYAALSDLIDNSLWLTVIANSGTEYQVQIQAFWDDEENGTLRCVASIDDGGFLTFMAPLSEDFIKNSNNEFVGE
jgi:hypothetical protein